jgi:hypothetical protein
LLPQPKSQGLMASVLGQMKGSGAFPAPYRRPTATDRDD